MKRLLIASLALPIVTFALDAPIVSITSTTDGDSVRVALSWSHVQDATSYAVYYKSDFDDSYSLLSYTLDNSYETSISTNWNWNFTPDIFGYFYVTADSISQNITGMVEIQPGGFVMGQMGVATPEHYVTLTRSFQIGRTEVTNSQYIEALNFAYSLGLVVIQGSYVCQNRTLYPLYLLDSAAAEIVYNADIDEFELNMSSYGIGDVEGPGFAFPNGYDTGSHPVKFVTWYGAASYCDWISIAQNLTPYYQTLWSQIPSQRNPYDAVGFRLPTEAEWEFTAQYDDERTYPWGNTLPNCEITNWDPGPYCVGWTSEVGCHESDVTYHGIMDMGGNVQEWTNDRYSIYTASNETNPFGAISGGNKVIRGGEWASDSGYSPLKCADRKSEHVSYASSWTGFRICRSILD